MSHLVLTVKKDEPLFIGPDITVSILNGKSSGSFKVGVHAPQGVQILRQKVAQRMNTGAEMKRLEDAALGSARSKPGDNSVSQK